MALNTKTAGGLVSPAAHNENGMVSIQITTPTICNGVRCTVGQIVETPIEKGRFLIAIKKALPAPEKAPNPTIRKPKTATRKK